VKLGVFMQTVFLAIVVGCHSTAAGPLSEPSVLKDVRYVVQPAFSRVTMHFQGDIKYTAVQQDNRIVIGFPRTRVASPPGAAKLEFKTGHVHGLTIDRITADSIRVIIVLRNRMTYRVVQPKADNQLYMDVTVDTGKAVAVASRPPVKPAVRQETSAKGAERKSALVDIPAIARTQLVDLSQRATAPHTEPQKENLQARENQLSPVQAEKNGRTSLSPVFLVLAVAVIAALSTGLLLFVASRRQVGITVAAPRSQATQPQSLPGPEPALPAPARPVKNRFAEEEEFPEVDEPERDDDTMQLARRFERGQNELSLALRLRGAYAASVGTTKVQKALTAKKSKAQQLNAARKLGVGRGELELALHLEQLQQHKLRKEELS